MILGIGVDVVEVADLARRLERETFLKVFSDRELAYADSLPLRRSEILAARWAAKEAFVKAVGTGLRLEWPMREIEVVHGENNRPAIVLGQALHDALSPGARIHCSLSHTPSWAVAYVVIEVAGGD